MTCASRFVNAAVLPGRSRRRLTGRNFTTERDPGRTEEDHQYRGYDVSVVGVANDERCGVGTEGEQAYKESGPAYPPVGDVVAARQDCAAA